MGGMRTAFLIWHSSCAAWRRVAPIAMMPSGMSVLSRTSTTWSIGMGFATGVRPTGDGLGAETFASRCVRRSPAGAVQVMTITHPIAECGAFARRQPLFISSSRIVNL